MVKVRIFFFPLKFLEHSCLLVCFTDNIQNADSRQFYALLSFQEGHTAMDLAVKNCREDIVEFLQAEKVKIMKPVGAFSLLMESLTVS